MKKLLFIPLALLFLICLANGAQAQVADHALPKVLKVAAAPVVHPKRTVKQVLGSVVFAAENVVDVAHAGLEALDKSTATELKAFNYVIHPADVLAGKADAGLEKAEFYFFGESN